MLWRPRSAQRPGRSVPLGFIHPCRPTVSKQPPIGDGWVHEVKHDGYRLQVHVGAGRVRLYTMNGADWTERYPRIVEEASRIKVAAVIDRRSSARTKRAALTSIACIAAASSTRRLHAPSISCGWTVTIYAESRSHSATPLCSSSSSVVAAVFNTFGMSRQTEKNRSKPPASLAWGASFRSG
jgi:ATP dependent DNA ligase domain